MRFTDRHDAGRQLAAALSRHRCEKPLVMALPRGGVPVAAEVAKALHAPLGVIVVRKIGAPHKPELALGAVVDGIPPIVVRNEDLIAITGTSAKRFGLMCRRELGEVERRRAMFLGGRPALDPRGRVTIVIDDGIATGATMRVALQAMRMQGAKTLIAAAPVAASGAMAEIRRLADEAVCLAERDDFGAVSAFYGDFHQLDDSDVVSILADFPEPPSTQQVYSSSQ